MVAEERFNRAYWWPWLGDIFELMAVSEVVENITLDRGFYLSIQCVNCHDYQGYLLNEKSSKHPFEGVDYTTWKADLLELTDAFYDTTFDEEQNKIVVKVTEAFEDALTYNESGGKKGILHRINRSRRYCTACHVRHRFDTRLPRQRDATSAGDFVGGTAHSTGRILMNDPDTSPNETWMMLRNEFEDRLWESTYIYERTWEAPDGYTADDGYGPGYGYEYSASYNDYSNIYGGGNRVRPELKPVPDYFIFDSTDVLGDQLFCLNCHDDSATYAGGDEGALKFNTEFTENGDAGGGPNALPYNPYDTTSYIDTEFYHNRIPRVDIKDFYTRGGHGKMTTSSDRVLKMRCAGIETCHNPHGSDAKGLLREYGPDIDIIRDPSTSGTIADGVFVDRNIETANRFGTVQPFIRDDRWKRSREHNLQLNQQNEDNINYIYTILNKEYWLRDEYKVAVMENENLGSQDDADLIRDNLNYDNLPFFYLNRFCYRCHTDGVDNRYYPGNTPIGVNELTTLGRDWLTFDSSAHGPYQYMEVDEEINVYAEEIATPTATDRNFNNAFDFDTTKSWTKGLGTRFRHGREMAGMCVNCHNPHGDGLPAEDPYAYEIYNNLTNYKDEALCFRCHQFRPETDNKWDTVIGFPVGAEVDILFDSMSAGDALAQEEPSPYNRTTAYHDVYDHAQAGYNNDPNTESKIECVNCHNVHISKRNYVPHPETGKRIPIEDSTNLALIDPDPYNSDVGGIDGLAFNFPFTVSGDGANYKNTVTRFCLRCHDADPLTNYPLADYDDLDPPGNLKDLQMSDKFYGELPYPVKFPTASNEDPTVNVYRLWNKNFFYYSTGHMNQNIKDGNTSNEFITGVSCIDCHNPHGTGIQETADTSKRMPYLLYESAFIAIDSTWVKSTDNGQSFCYQCHKYPMDNGFYNGQQGWYSEEPFYGVGTGDDWIRYSKTLNGYDSSIHGYVGGSQERRDRVKNVYNRFDYEGEGGYGHAYDSSDGGKCINCHNPHGTAQPNPNMTMTGVGEKLCFACHDETASDSWIEHKGRNIKKEFFAGGEETRDDGGSLHNIDDFTQGTEGMYIECISCHNVHVVTGKYQDEAVDTESPLTNPEWPVLLVVDDQNVIFDETVTKDDYDLWCESNPELCNETIPEHLSFNEFQDEWCVDNPADCKELGLNLTTYCLICHDADGQNLYYDTTLIGFVESGTWDHKPDFGPQDDSGEWNTRRYIKYPDNIMRDLDEFDNIISKPHHEGYPATYSFSLDFSTTNVKFPAPVGVFDKSKYYRINGHGGALTTSISDPQVPLMVECAGGECHLPHGSTNDKLITDATTDVDNDTALGVPQYNRRYVTGSGNVISLSWVDFGAALEYPFDLSPVDMKYWYGDTENLGNDTRDNFCNVGCHRPDLQHAFTYDRAPNGAYQAYLNDDVYNFTRITYRLRDPSESDGTQTITSFRRDPNKRFGHPSDSYMPGLADDWQPLTADKLPTRIVGFPGELNLSDSEESFVDAESGFKLYNKKFICLTCHDPHGTGGLPFGSGIEYTPDALGEWRPYRYRGITKRWIDKDPRDSASKEGMTRLEPDNAELCRRCHNLAKSLDRIFDPSTEE